jgi:hypothetical protein
MCSTPISASAIFPKKKPVPQRHPAAASAKYAVAWPEWTGSDAFAEKALVERVLPTVAVIRMVLALSFFDPVGC